MATIATLDAILRARTSKFDKPISTSQSVVGKFSSSVIAKFAAVGAAAAGLAATMKGFASAGDAIDKMSARTGLAASELQSLTFAFQQSGGSASDVEAAVRGMSRNILDASRGLATAKDNFDDLGISLDDLEGKTVGERFEFIAKALNGVEDESEKAGLAMKFFGRSGTQVLPLIKSMDKLTEQYDKLGIALTDEQVSLAAELTDEWNIQFQSVKKLGAELAELAGPGVLLLTKGLGAIARMAAFVTDKLGFLLKPVNALLDAANKFADFLFGSGSSPTVKLKTETKLETPKTDQAIKDLQSTEKKQSGILENIKRTIAELPPALQRGQAGTVSFINKLVRKDESRRIVRELEKLNNTEEKTLFETRRNRRLQKAFILRPV